MQLKGGLPGNTAGIELLKSIEVGAFRLELEAFIDKQTDGN